MSGGASVANGAIRLEMVAIAVHVTGPLAQVVAVWDRLRAQHGIAVRLDAGSNDRTLDLSKVLAEAHDRGLLRPFAVDLHKEGLVGPDFASAVGGVLGPSPSAMQAFTNGVFRPVDALLAARGQLLACEHVCRIDIDGEQKGTGVLVRPTLVATAAHVIMDLIKERPGKTPVARRGSLGRLTLVFGDVEDYLPDKPGVERRKGEVASLHDPWLELVSSPTTNERSRELFDIENIEGIAAPDGPWDLALIRLAKPPRPGLKGHDLLADEPPSNPFAIHVLHHPNGALSNGQPMQWSYGSMGRGLGAPVVRRLHDANTAPGSSGAPCFDSGWRVVAVHQAGRANGQGLHAANRAVPIYHWRPKVDELEARIDTTPYLAELDDEPGGSPHPVLGRRRTQRRLWRAMQPDAGAVDRLFIVRGDPGTGKRFTRRLVQAMVKGRGDAVATLDMTNVQQDDAPAFARRLVGTLGEALAAESTRASLLTTEARDIRNDLVPGLLSELDHLAGEHAVWLVLERFEAAGLQAFTNVPQVVDELMARLERAPKLRLLLLGWQAPVDRRLTDSVEDLGPPTDTDIVDYLQLRYSPPGSPIERAKLLSAVQGYLEFAPRTGPEAQAEVFAALAPLRRALNQRLLAGAVVGRAA